MVSECFERRIERPCGISGYRPSAWCAVCGRTESLQPVKGCTREECANTCHVGCLGGAEVFECGNTGQLRALAGIIDPVTPYIPRTQATPDPPSQENLAAHTSTDSAAEGNTDDDLDDLRKEELVKLVRSLRKDLAGVKSQLSYYRSASEDLVDKRQVLLEALSVVDTLLAIRSSEGTLQCTVACSAKPHKIDEVAETDVDSECDPSSPTDSSQPSPLPPFTPGDSPPTSHSSPSSPSPPLPSTSLPPSSPPLPPSTPVNTPPTLHSSPSLPSSPSTSHPPSSPLPAPAPVTSTSTTPTSPPSQSPLTPPPTSVVPPHISTSTSPSRAPTPNPPHPSHSSSPLPLPQPASSQGQGVPLSREDSNASGPRGAQGQGRSQGGSNQQKKKKRKPAPRSNAATGGAPSATQPPRQEVLPPRQQQAWCSQCRRRGHDRDQCPKEACDYCQGRNHSSLTCYIRIADQRQKELVQAVRQSGQETLLALRSVAWRLHQPPQPHQAAVPTYTAPHGTSAPAQWPQHAPVYPGYYGARSQQYHATPQGGQ